MLASARQILSRPDAVRTWQGPDPSCGSVDRFVTKVGRRPNTTPLHSLAMRPLPRVWPCAAGSTAKAVDVRAAHGDHGLMKALTIKQPWAELIIAGLKDVETAVVGPTFVAASPCTPVSDGPTSRISISTACRSGSESLSRKHGSATRIRVGCWALLNSSTARRAPRRGRSTATGTGSLPTPSRTPVRWRRRVSSDSGSGNGDRHRRIARLICMGASRSLNGGSHAGRCAGPALRFSDRGAGRLDRRAADPQTLDHFAFKSATHPTFKVAAVSTRSVDDQ